MLCSRQLLYVTIVLGTVGGAGCQGALGLNDYHVESREPAAPRVSGLCSSHLDCQTGTDSVIGDLCTPEHRCAAPRNEQCSVLTKPVQDAQALVLGSLFATSGPSGTYNAARQNAVVMAVDEINERGGVPAAGTSTARKLVLVSCDTGAGAADAARQLIKLGALAVIGPAESDAVIDVSMKLTIAAGTLLVSPTAMSSSINDLLDSDLSWLMAPTAEQRAPLMKLALSALEKELSAERTRELKLGVVFDDDALGRSSLASLQDATFAGEALSASGTRSGRVRLDRFPSEAADRAALVAAYRAFAPDVVVLLGQSPVITEWLAPLERSYESSTDARPYYLITEPAKTSELLGLAQQISGLRGRVRGVSVTPSDRARPVFEGFQNRFETRFGEGAALAPGVGAAYDALYAVVYALASVEPEQARGARVASALHWLSGGSELVAVGTAEMSTAFRKLSARERIATLGTMSELRWDDSGGTRAGALEVFCLAGGDGAARFSSSGLRWDVSAQQLMGTYSACGTRVAAVPSDGVKTGVASGELPPDGSQPAAADGSGSLPAEEQPPAAGSGNAQAGSQAASSGVGGVGGTPPMAMGGMTALPAAGSGGSAGAPAMLAARTSQSCGDRRSCRLDRSEYCCISEVRTVTGPLPTDLSCKTGPSVAPGAGAAGMPAGAAMCAISLHCSSDRECMNGQLCCADETSARCMSQAECSAQNHRRLQCALPGDCPGGSECCIRTEQNLSAFSGTQCEARCSFAAGSGKICQSDADCPMEGNTKFVCNQSYVLPTLRVCWPAQ